MHLPLDLETWILDALAPKRSASTSNPGSGNQAIRRPPSDQIQDPPRLRPEDLQRFESSKDLCDTASFKDLKIPASFARSASPREVCRSFGGEFLALPRTSQRTDRSSVEPPKHLGWRFGEQNDIPTTAPKSRRPSAIPISGPPAREALRLAFLTNPCRLGSRRVLTAASLRKRLTFEHSASLS
jgi:hypothetical protein